MELEIFKTQIFKKPEDYCLDLPLFEHDIPALVNKIKKDDAWRKEPLNSMTLMQTESKRSVLVTLSSKTQINSKQTSKMIVFQVFEGVVIFQSKKDTIVIKEGQRFVYRQKGSYKLIAQNDSIVLLTLIPIQKQPSGKLVIYN